MLGGPRRQRAHQVHKLRIDPVDRIAHPQPEIGRHLVVARARRVQSPAGIADALDQARLDVHVDVFQRLGEREFFPADLGRDVPEPALDRGCVLGRQNPDLRQHRRVRERGLDVLPPHLAVEADRRIYRLHDRRGSGSEATAPLCVGVGFVLVRRLSHERHSIMQPMRRRAILTAAGALAGGTLAAVTLWRKQANPPVATPVLSNEPVALHPFSTLTLVDPPRPLADAAFDDADGRPHHLAEFAGKGLVVNLWATWCAPCVAEMPALQVFAKAAAADGILVLPLASDRGGKDAVRVFYAAHGIMALPIWLDPKAQAAEAWGARGLPTTLIVDRQGREVASLEGAVDWAAEATLAGVRRLVGDERSGARG